MRVTNQVQNSKNSELAIKLRTNDLSYLVQNQISLNRKKSLLKYSRSQRDIYGGRFSLNSAILSQSSEESDEEEKAITFIDQKMRLCFIDIVKSKTKESHSVKKDSMLFQTFETIAKEHPLLKQLDLELSKCLLNNCELKLVKQTHKLYYQGDAKTKTDCFYIILFGKFALVREHEGTKRIICAERIGRTVGEEIALEALHNKRVPCIMSES